MTGPGRQELQKNFRSGFILAGNSNNPLELAKEKGPLALIKLTKPGFSIDRG